MSTQRNCVHLYTMFGARKKSYFRYTQQDLGPGGIVKSESVICVPYWCGWELEKGRHLFAHNFIIPTAAQGYCISVRYSVMCNGHNEKNTTHGIQRANTSGWGGGGYIGDKQTSKTPPMLHLVKIINSHEIHKMIITSQMWLQFAFRHQRRHLVLSFIQ